MLNVLSGWQTANIKSFPIKTVDKEVNGVTRQAQIRLDQGDWVKFEEGALVKADSYDGTFAVFPVYAGNVSFYDTRYHGRADVVTARSAIIETDKVEADPILAGDAVTVSANAKLTKTTDAASAVGFAIEDLSAAGIIKVQLI